MISCTSCKNNGYCSRWKSLKIDARELCCNVGLVKVLAAKLDIGLHRAKNCKKFQEFSKVT